MALPDQRGNNRINAEEFSFRQIDAGSGIPEGFPVPAVSKESVIVVFMGNGTAGMSLITSVADIGSPFKPVAALFDKILTVLVTRGEGSTFNIAENELAADILLLTMEAVYTEVFGIEEEPPAGIEVG